VARSLSKCSCQVWTSTQMEWRSPSMDRHLQGVHLLLLLLLLAVRRVYCRATMCSTAVR
jgi:hypothetical protein